MILTYILIFTFLGSIVSLAGSIILLAKKRLTESFINMIINFAAGTLLAVAFLDLFPEALDQAGEANIFLPALLGFLTFFFAERFIHWFHRHHEHGNKIQAPLILIGDGLHNFIDGVAITASFLTSIPLGITTAIAVAAHEIPQEIADMGVLLASGYTKRKALFYNFLSALTALAGALVAFYFSSYLKENLYIFLSATAGFFIYIAASDLIPELHEKYQQNRKLSYSLIFILGIATVFAFTKLLEG